MVLPTYHHALASYAPGAKMGGEAPAPQSRSGRHPDPIGTKSRGVSRTWRLRGTTPPAGDQRVRNGGRAGQILAQSALGSVPSVWQKRPHVPGQADSLPLPRLLLDDRPLRA